MRKQLYQQYIVVIIALLVVVMVPKGLQEVFRNQFLKAMVPFSRFGSSNSPFAKNVPDNFDPSLLELPQFSDGTMAKIIYRNPSTWNSFFWINIGKKNTPSIKINSPVLHHGTLIGNIDYVGQKQSRVQLVTNSNLTISVQALRGKDQYLDIMEHLSALSKSEMIKQNEYLYDQIIAQLETLEKQNQNWHLTSGEISGLSQPLWRGNAHTLQGRGFKTHFNHETEQADSKMPLIQNEDLLVTTGLDGVFPEGIMVARVKQVDPLKDSSYYYTLIAEPIEKSFNYLKIVEVIPPVEFQYEDVKSY